jgi:hypothetical protein
LLYAGTVLGDRSDASSHFPTPRFRFCLQPAPGNSYECGQVACARIRDIPIVTWFFPLGKLRMYALE